MMIQSRKITCIDRERAKELALTAMNQIISEYEQEINKFKQLLTEKDTKLMELQRIIIQKDDQLKKMKQKQQNNIKSFNQQLVTHLQDKAQLQLQLKTNKYQYERELTGLNDQLNEKEKELTELKERLNLDLLSKSLSSISKRDHSSIKGYSFEFTNYFQDYPQTTLKLLNSLPEEKPTDPAQRGDMFCMLISRDQMSVEKYGEINRTFLKRKLKQEEKRFRFVIIYKPQKAS